MTWFKFLCWLSGIYALYYLANILWDMAAEKRTPKPKGWVNELRFSEDFIPQKIEPDTAGLKGGVPAVPVTGTGGVPLKDLFTLARKDILVYTLPVSF